MSKLNEKAIRKILKYWKIKLMNIPKIVQCENCNRLAISNNDCLSLEYCHKMGIKFTCGSCKFPQYRDSLNTSMRGNVERIYGKTFNIKQNKWIEPPITQYRESDA